MDKTRGLMRKGAWTYEEDKLLKDCINKYGEGKWHLVPQRAGLNRCRKSCRLRWLNYLNPTINRESFAEDEVDMILRLHKLLGNRWSLIAARLPGRTANDVKNYWHTHLRKKVVPRKIEEKKKPLEITMKTHEVIKPQPRTFSSHSLRLNEKHNNYVKPIVTVSTKDVTVANDGDKECTMLPINGDGDSAAQPYAENFTMSTKWWESLLNVTSDKIGSCSLLQEKEYSNLEFANVESFLNQDPEINVPECYWEPNIGEFDSLLDILN